jgi:transcription antitermination factor NusG
MYRNSCNWYAVHTRSNFEARVAAQIAGKGMESYLPCYEEAHKWKDRLKTIQVPLFTGYVFTRFYDCPEARIAVLQTPGVARIVGWGDQIEPVQEEELGKVKALLEARMSCMPHPYLRQGDWVRVKRGALKGLEGYLVRTKANARLVISLAILEKSVSTEVDAKDVEAAKGPLLSRGTPCIRI